MKPLGEQLFEIFRKNYPQSVRGLTEARQVNPQRFDDLAELFLAWAVRMRGPEVLHIMAEAFVHFTFDINMAQARYESDGHYPHQSFEQVNNAVYGHNEFMDDYLWGSYLSNILWAHHVKISHFYRDHFIERLPDDCRIIEIAPGHGTWGLWALHEKPAAQLEGYDISPAAVALANEFAGTNDFAARAIYREKNALDLTAMPAACADACVCSFLVEHLEQPTMLFAAIRHLLKADGIAYISGALTAAQIDHIYEFKRESELVMMCEDNGLRVVDMTSAAPCRTLPGARFQPRSMAMIVQPNHFVYH